MIAVPSKGRRKSTRILEFAAEVIETGFTNHYSESKFRDYQKYSEEASLIATVLSCFVLAAISFLSVVFITVAFPVESIQAGLTGKNWNQIGMLTFGGLGTALMFDIRYRKIVFKSQMKLWQRCVTAISLPITVAVTAITIEKSWIYPVPFVMVCCSGPGITTCMCFYLWFERNNWKNIKAQLHSIAISITISFSTVLVHDLVGVLYRSQAEEPLYQAGVGFLLPLIRITLQRTTRWMLGDKVEGLYHALSIFEVKFFNSLYTSMFTQSTVNIFVRLSLLIWVLLENIYFLYNLNSLGQQYVAEKKPKAKEAKLRKLLVRTELVVLLELVEVVIPIVYGCFLIVLRHASNLKYYPELNALSNEEFNDSIFGLALLAILELLTFASLLSLLKIRFNLNLLHQVGFFLIEYKSLVLSTISVWICVALGSGCTHIGNDYSFQFSSEDFYYLSERSDFHF